MAIVENGPSETEQKSSLVDTLVNKFVFPKDAEGIPKPPIALGLMVVVVAAIGLGLYRWYMEATAFTLGLDYFEPEFQIYWMSWFYGQLGVTALLGVVGLPYIWFTRPSVEEVRAMEPSKELGIYILVFTIAAVSSVMVISVLGIWVEADAAWHQVTIRDTDFTPTHISLFYGVIPLAIAGGAIGFVWVHTRMPDFRDRISFNLAFAIAGAAMIMPNLGLNEWGHTFFYAEELFAAPIHWGFVTLGWAFFAIGGVIIQVLSRMTKLTRMVVHEQKTEIEAA